MAIITTNPDVAKTLLQTAVMAGAEMQQALTEIRTAVPKLATLDPDTDNAVILDRLERVYERDIYSDWDNYKETSSALEHLCHLIEAYCDVGDEELFFAVGYSNIYYRYHAGEPWDFVNGKD